ncbi:PREDICTED: glucose dehydrogenase [FAD, quinone]-like isoform X2 [Dinoponera quadriceps]|uniref:Glucose dehydrogenase [FAD, quinone]-like isoform X2 n=1 Tax=Dinoponera quadriceps TaxID=609295 RepID=A0A6P3XF21_DINQU|nr:PREDICTED: glucose dehydrogenase [FAD, quinone]-like isoform X2 [Dinoponera quadriceps]
MKIVKEADVIMPMPSLLSPKSTGELRLRNKDPAVPVKIYAKSFSEQEDVEMMLKWNLHLSFYYFHACGTVKMGPRNDPTAVVDATLRIHGVQRLRVIDASIMPNINSETTVGPAMMIGEKGADLIKEDWTVNQNSLTFIANEHGNPTINPNLAIRHLRATTDLSTS